MSKADESLTDVRKWLCDNLSKGDAGKACSMLSVVSRYISELEAENAKLQEQVTQLQDDWESEHDYADQMEAKEKRVVSENAKLREFVEMFAKVADEVGCDHCPYCEPDMCDEETNPMENGCRLYEELRELGIEVDK